jgi:ankyrin repeat protein
MHSAALNGHVDTIKILKEAGSDVSVHMNDGSTPMHWAAWNGYVKAIKALKEAGANVSMHMNDRCIRRHYMDTSTRSRH